MRKLRTLSLEESDQWLRTVENSYQYDVYHLPAFHKLDDVVGDPHLFVYSDYDCFIALPLVLRDVEKIPGLTKCGRGWRDATSVYGYPGPISSESDPPESMLRGFATDLREELERRSVIAVFSRLNPLLQQRNILTYAGGRIITKGPTVAIDLQQPPETQFRQYRTNMQRDIRSSKEAGAVCRRDDPWKYLNDFIDIYYETMERVGAASRYFFSADYFRRFRESLQGKAHLFVVLLGGEPICGGLFTHCQRFIQYHLGGTRTDYRHLAPTKLMFDTVRLWGNTGDASYFHLGGGVGAKEDGLFNFKLGFSNLKLDFRVWQAVLNEQVYTSLASERQAWLNARGHSIIDDEYFPIYRHPIAQQDAAER